MSENKEQSFTPQELETRFGHLRQRFQAGELNMHDTNNFLHLEQRFGRLRTRFGLGGFDADAYPAYSLKYINTIPDQVRHIVANILNIDPTKVEITTETPAPKAAGKPELDSYASITQALEKKILNDPLTTTIPSELFNQIYSHPPSQKIGSDQNVYRRLISTTEEGKPTDLEVLLVTGHQGTTEIQVTLHQALEIGPNDQVLKTKAIKAIYLPQLGFAFPKASKEDFQNQARSVIKQLYKYIED